jgi:type IV secretion system protein VirD4
LIDTAKLKRYVLPCLPYAFLFWFFDKCGEAVRTAPGRDILQKLIGGAANLNAAFSAPFPSFDLLDVCVGLAGAAAVYCAVLYRKKHAKKWRRELLCYKGWRWTTPTKPGSHGVCGTDGRTAVTA